MAIKRRSRKSKALNVYANLSRKRRTKKDRALRKKAEYLASLPKHPVKRFFYRLHPKRVVKFWFSKRGAIMALKLSGVAILIGVLTIGAVFAYYRKELDQIRPDKIAERVQTTVTKYYDRNDKLLWEDKGGGNYRLAVEFDQISDYMKQATVALEDRDFYKHDGVSFTGIARSAFNNARGGEVQGGSTLTQQLVKQVFLADESHDRGFGGIPRKIKEVILAFEVERMYSKEDILKMYLNESPYGGRRNGVESAAQTYFGKPAAKLNLSESALLAAIPNQPGLYDPYNVAGNEALIARQHKALDAMVTMNYITKAEADKAKKVAILDRLKPLSDQYKDIKAPHFVLMVRKQLEQELGEAIVGRGGLTVKTTLDLRIQNKLEAEMKEMFDSYMPSYAGFTNGAATVEDVRTGQIVALMGSRDFTYPGFGQDNAATAFIQPGSTIKPLVYAELFADHGSKEQNFGSGSILADDRSMDKIYGAPLQNADRSYRGAITVRKSLGLSRNVPAVKAMYISGIDNTKKLIRDLGNKSYCTQGVEKQAGLASAIGGCGTRMVDHVNAFASLARMGVYKPHTTVLEVKNNRGEILKTYKEDSKKVLDPQAAYIVSDILADPSARAGLWSFNTPGVEKMAVKTGTSDRDGKAKDIWTMGYTPALAMGVWLGNSDNRLLTNGNSSIPSSILRDVMQYAHLDVYVKENKWHPGDWFKRPSGIQVIKGELYPSYYEKSQNQKAEKMTFDRLSKKLATDCTPADAKIEIDVVTYRDPVSKKDVTIAPDGYNPREDDDVHKCSDSKPSVGVSVDRDGENFTVSYRGGRFKIKLVTVSVNGRQIEAFSANGSGVRTIKNTAGNNSSINVSVKITDDGYYSDSASTSWSPQDDRRPDGWPPRRND